MKKIVSTLTLFTIMFLLVSVTFVSAEGTTGESGLLYVNDDLVENESTVMFDGDAALIPLRTTFEALNAVVEWQQDTGNIEITYLNEIYICEFHTIGETYKSITVKNKNLNNGSLGKYIPLNAMSGSGSYKVINDRTYLYQDTAKRLLEALGCKVEVESDTHTVKIFN